MDTDKVANSGEFLSANLGLFFVFNLFTYILLELLSQDKRTVKLWGEEYKTKS